MKQTNTDVNVYKDMKSLLGYIQTIKTNTNQYLEKRRWFALPQNVTIAQKVSNFMESGSLENWVRTLEELIEKLQEKTNFSEKKSEEIAGKTETVGNNNTMPDNDFFQLLKEIGAHLINFNEISKQINEEVKKIREQELFWVTSPAYKDIKELFDILGNTIGYSSQTVTCMISIQKIYEDSLKCLNKEHDKIEEEKKALIEEKEKMGAERKDWETKVSSLENEIEGLKDKVNSLKQENEGLIELCTQLNTRIGGLNSDLDKAKEQIERLQEEVAAHKRKENKLLQDIVHLKENIDVLKIDLEKTNEENKKLKSVLKKAEKSYESMRKNQETNQETIRAQEDNINKLKEKIKSAEDKERHLQQELHSRCMEVLAFQKERAPQGAHQEVNKRNLGFFKKPSLPDDATVAHNVKEGDKLHVLTPSSSS